MIRYHLQASCTVLLLLLVLSKTTAQQFRLQRVETGTEASFRGMSAVDDSVAWVSGSKGWIGVTENGGSNWRFGQVKGYEQCDFRSIYAHDSRNAVIANAGSPAYILHTTDGGLTWRKVYENTDTAAFIDGVDFLNEKVGMIYGDPIGGRMLLLLTADGGWTWNARSQESSPELVRGEASFAASGTCIKYIGVKKVVIATGGEVSRIFVSVNGGNSWKPISTPILQGESSMGIFSFLALSHKRWVIAGGDYKRDTLRTANLFYTYNGGKKWHAPKVTTRGYRECLASLRTTGRKRRAMLAVGPSGVDISYDDGRKWVALSDVTQLHVVKRSRNGKLVLAAGGAGKLYILKME